MNWNLILNIAGLICNSVLLIILWNIFRKNNKKGIRLQDVITRDIGEIGTKERDDFEQEVINGIKDN